MPRDFDLERYLLIGTPQPLNSAQVRRPVPKKKVLPFGARGRKRTIMFIGLKPNLDGHKTVPPPETLARTSLIPETSALTPPVSPIRPAKCTYRRATSTPFANRPAHRPRAFSTPYPREPVDSTADDTSANIDFDDASFGRLHYDTSDTE